MSQFSGAAIFIWDFFSLPFVVVVVCCAGVDWTVHFYRFFILLYHHYCLSNINPLLNHRVAWYTRSNGHHQSPIVSCCVFSPPSVDLYVVCGTARSITTTTIRLSIRKESKKSNFETYTAAIYIEHQRESLWFRLGVGGPCTHSSVCTRILLIYSLSSLFRSFVFLSLFMVRESISVNKRQKKNIRISSSSLLYYLWAYIYYLKFKIIPWKIRNNNVLLFCWRCFHDKSLQGIWFPKKKNHIFSIR